MRKYDTHKESIKYILQSRLLLIHDVKIKFTIVNSVINPMPLHTLSRILKSKYAFNFKQSTGHGYDEIIVSLISV